ADFKQRAIRPENLQLDISLDETMDQIIKKKLKDIALIYQRFSQYMEGRYIDSEDYMDLLIEKLEAYSLLENARVWIDGFTTFAPQTLRIIEKIMLMAHDTTICFTLDPDRDKADLDLFRLPGQSYGQIREMARKYGLKEELICVDPQQAETLKSPEINHMEAELFAYPGKIFDKKLHNLEIFAASSIDSEVEALAAELLLLARKGYRWKEMAVVCHDMDRYGSLIKRTFRDYGIPCFMDRKRDIMSHPIIELIMAALEIISRGYRYEDVFTYLKTGFSDLDEDGVELLEKYALEFGIKGEKWREEFQHAEAEDLVELNQKRLLFIKPLEDLAMKVKGNKAIKELSQAVYEFLENTNTYYKLEKWTDDLRVRGFLEEASESSQLWNATMEVLNQMVEIMGEQKANLKDFKRTLEAGFLSFEIKIIPTTVDQVLLGDIQRSKSHDIKCLFVIGVNDGILPSLGREEGILSEAEKEALQEKGLDLGYEREMNWEEERFLIYSALAKPAERIRLSYALADEEGKALRPSLLIDQVRKLFPSVSLKTNLIENQQWQLQMIATPESSFKHLVEKLRLALDGKELEGFWWDAYRWYYEQESWQGARELLIQGLFHNNQPEPIQPEVSRCLFGSPLRSSVSRLEQFVSCPFAHFVRYGLQPQERKTYELRSPDLGLLFHDSLLSFSHKLREDNKSWLELQKEDCCSLIDTVVDEIALSFGNGIFSSHPRYRHLLKRLKRISRRAVWTLTEHLQQGEFKPLDYEISFGRGGVLPAVEIDLENGEKLFLEGRIDRVDLLELDESCYVRILDYKSGQQDFHLSEVFHGLTLQLMLYLKAVLAAQEQVGSKQVIPAGVFYFKIDDPMINSEEKIVEVVEKEIAKKLKMKGLVIADAKIVRQMDREVNGYSTILPLGLNQKDEFYRFSSVLPSQDFFAMMRHVEQLLKKIGQEIISGQLRIEPVYTRGRLACAYCPYPSICQFDRLFSDNNWRYLKPLTREEVLTRLKEDN
ncbi:MAG: helicase-exonuclease AddAB subunit AddB, partial [Syntrophomonas sp.]|nr:helicase-exonuclease AddAB subunit AddB [Syntrophomonas sp.]